MYNVWMSVWRTLVPYVLALLAVEAAKVGLHVDVEGLQAPLMLAGGTVYYAVVRWAEKRWPALGWMLGAPRAPEYKQVSSGG
jgi:hypothetical protein